MSQNQNSVSLVELFALSMVDSAQAAGTRAQTVRSIVELENITDGESPMLAACVLETFKMLAPLNGLVGEARAEAQNRFNATLRTALVSALRPLGLTAKLSVKADKLIAGRIKVSVTVAEWVKPEKSAYELRKNLESLQGQLARLIKENVQTADEAQNEALAGLLAQFETVVGTFADKL